MNTNISSTKFKNTVITHSSFAVSLLSRIKNESIEEFREMEETFELMGWGNLPNSLKIEIYDDVKAMVMELKGLYCSHSEFVDRRRNTVQYWVSAFQDGICSLQTAIKALKVKTI